MHPRHLDGDFVPASALRSDARAAWISPSRLKYGEKDRETALSLINLHMDSNVGPEFANELVAAIIKAGRPASLFHGWAAARLKKDLGASIGDWGHQGNVDRMVMHAIGERIAAENTERSHVVVNANPMAAQFCEHPQILKCIMDAEPYLSDSINVHVFGEPRGELRIADQQLFSAVGLWAPDAIRAREGQQAVERILAAMGLIPFEPAWAEQSPAKPLVMAIRSCGPGGFGSIARRATLDAAALQAWEAARGREPGEGAQAFARLVELACRRKSWRPELAWSEPASMASLSLSPLGDSSPPSALKAGKPSLEREVEEAGKSMGLRVSFGKR